MLTLKYITHKESTADATIYTFSACDIGTAASDRYVVIGVTGRGNATRTVSTLTIGGTSATKIIERVSTSNNEDTTSLWWANITSGATADIVVTWNNSRARCGIGVWTLNEVSPTVYQSTSGDGPSNTTPLTLSLNVNSGGCAIGILESPGAISASTWTWTGITEDFDCVLEGDTTHTGASKYFAAATALTITITPDQNDLKCGCAASFDAYVFPNQVTVGTGSSKSRYIKRDWPFTDGLTAGTTSQKGHKEWLEPALGTLIPKRERIDLK